MAGSTKRDKSDRAPAKKAGRTKDNVKPNNSREIKISKALSFLLRHGANTEGVAIDEGGWANVADVLAWRRLANLSVTLADIRAQVATSDKQRFALKPSPTYPNPSPSSSPPSHQPSLDPAAYLVRATQGHSLKTLSAELILQPLPPDSPKTPRYVVHGTYAATWPRILASGGLKPMSRNHIHFATSLPSALPPLDPERPRKVGLVDDAGQEVVLSGMRRDATVLVWVDVVRSAVEGGVKWWRSSNGVVLTDGVEGVLEMRWVKWVERRGTDEVMWGSKEEGVQIPVEEGEGEDGVVVGKVVEGVEGLVLEDKGGKVGGKEGKLKDNWDD